MPECNYCGKDVKTRGMKNHIRMSGEPHGPQGEMPTEDESSDTDESASQDADADSNGDVTEVSPEEFEASETTVSASEENEDSDDEYPFDTSSSDALELDGDEELIVVSPDGRLTEAYADEGDWLVIADDGKPYLYEDETGDLYEVKTE